MAVRQRVLDDARQRARNVHIQIGSEIRGARLAAGLSLATVAAAVKRSKSWLSRVERGTRATVTLDEMMVVAAAVGLKLWMSTFPAERAIRDAPQLDLLRRLRARVGGRWTWRYEVVVPIVGDRRAADAVIRCGATVVMVEAFTRLADAQAQLRAVMVKARDLGIGRVVIVIGATHTNRRALQLAADVVAADFPLGTRATLAALEAGRDPGANGIVLL